MLPLTMIFKPGRTHLFAVTLVILAASVFPIDPFPSSLQAVQGIDGQYSGKQGEVLIVLVPAASQPESVVGRFLGRAVSFYRGTGSGEDGAYVGLLGIDMQDNPGTHELLVEMRNGAGSRRLSYNVLVLKGTFPVQRLTLPKDMVDLDAPALARVKGEQEQVGSLLATVTPDRRWTTGFIEPVKGNIAGAFGRMRMINGQPRNPHNGEDIAAEAGTPVVASNDGVVQLTVEHYFSGKGVYLDHGLGLYSMYFHLSEIVVREGERVSRGQVIGRVGASGRVTGPHLHWGIRLNGARVDPYALVRLPLDGSPHAAR